MDEKTEALRDIFVETTGEESVTETQEESPGSLATDEEGVDERIAAVVERMRDRFEFTTELDTAALVALVREFYDRADDGTIAADSGSSRDAIFRARMDLHLISDEDAEAPFDIDGLRGLSDDAVERVASDPGMPSDDVLRYRRLVDAKAEARSVSHRFQSEFEDALADAGLGTAMTESMREDGLDEATEDIGSLEEDADVSF